MVKFLLVKYLQCGTLFRLERMVLVRHRVDRSRIGLAQKSDQPVNYENFLIFFHSENVFTIQMTLKIFQTVKHPNNKQMSSTHFKTIVRKTNASQLIFVHAFRFSTGFLSHCKQYFNASSHRRTYSGWTTFVDPFIFKVKQLNLRVAAHEETLKTCFSLRYSFVKHQRTKRLLIETRFQCLVCLRPQRTNKRLCISFTKLSENFLKFKCNVLSWNFYACSSEHESH